MNPQGANGIRGIDHAIVCVRDLDEARATYARLGFALTPRGEHTLGSRNHLAMFGADYLELLAPPPPESVPEASAFGYFARFLQTGDGLAGVALASDDAPAAGRALGGAGIEAGAPLALSRPVSVDGAAREARFTLVDLPARATPGARMFLCQHHTPELVWREPLPLHANGAIGLAAVAILCADDEAVRAHAASHARVFGGAPLPVAEGLKVETGGAPLVFLTERSLARRLPGVWITAKADPVPAALFIHVADRSRVARVLREGGFHPVALPDGAVAVGAAEAHGVALVFG